MTDRKMQTKESTRLIRRDTVNAQSLSLRIAKIKSKAEKEDERF